MCPSAKIIYSFIYFIGCIPRPFPPCANNRSAKTYIFPTPGFLSLSGAGKVRCAPVTLPCSSFVQSLLSCSYQCFSCSPPQPPGHKYAAPLEILEPCPWRTTQPGAQSSVSLFLFPPPLPGCIYKHCHAVSSCQPGPLGGLRLDLED